MEDLKRIPEPLDCSNLAKQWPIWKTSFQVYMMASGKAEEVPKKQLATFLWLIGPEAIKIYSTLFPNNGTLESMIGLSVNEEGNAVMLHKLEDVIKAFDKFCVPRRNVAMETFKFNNICQKERQRFTDFETELRTQMQFCEFKCKCGILFEERMLKDRILFGISDKTLQLKLLTEDKTAAEMIEACKAKEAALENKQLLENSSNRSDILGVREEKKVESVDAVRRTCFNCGLPFTTSHSNVCKARTIICHSCGKQGHFAKFCKLRGGGSRRLRNDGSRKEVNSVDWTEAEE